MSKEMKMSDVFELPVEIRETQYDYSIMQQPVSCGTNGAGFAKSFVGSVVKSDKAVAIRYVINNHDRLVEENHRLTEIAAQKASRVDELFEQLTSLFERVSGCSVSDFDEEQLPYLADMIEGQMDADEACINDLKSRKTIADYLKANEAMLTKTKAKMVSIESLKKFAGIKGSDND